MFISYSIKRKKAISPIQLGFLVFFLFVVIVFPISLHLNNFKVSAVFEKSVEVQPEDKLVINFSVPMARASVESSFSILPAQKVFFKWENNYRKLSIIPEKAWKPQTLYNVEISNGKDIFFQKFKESLSFRTQNFPTIKKFFPEDGQKNVAVDMEEPVLISFDKSLNNYNIKFVVSPEVPLGWEINEEKNQVSLLARDNFDWDTEYSIQVFIKNKSQNSDEFVKAGKTAFRTILPPAPETWDKDPLVRAEQAKKYTTAQIHEGKYIDINLSKQMMVIFENGVSLDGYLISSGKKGMETPIGTFKIENKADRPWSKKYALFMPHWMAILPSGLVGIHELPVWPGGFQEGASHLGIPVSHGCVRLGSSSAKRVFDWAEIGTPVVIHL